MKNEELKEEFDKNLKAVYKLLNDRNETNNIQLKRLCDELFGSKFYGVYPSDKIPNLNFHKKYCILNLDKSPACPNLFLSKSIILKYLFKCSSTIPLDTVTTVCLSFPDSFTEKV